MLTEQEHAARRMKIVRRQAAQRVSRAQREIWKRKKRHEAEEDDTDDSTETFGTTDDSLLAGLPELI
jgi:hypothetical protein